MAEFSLQRLMLLISLCSLMFASLAQQGDPIQATCPKTRNPKFCFEYFKGDHGKTVKDLAVKAVVDAQRSASRTYDLLTTLVKETTDPGLKGKYLSCLKNYGDAIFELELASGFLNNPKGFSARVFNAQYAVADCYKGLGGVPGVGGRPIQPPKLNQGSEETSNLCSIAIILSNIL